MNSKRKTNKKTFKSFSRLRCFGLFFSVAGIFLLLIYYQDHLLRGQVFSELGQPHSVPQLERQEQKNEKQRRPASKPGSMAFQTEYQDARVILQKEFQSDGFRKIVSIFNMDGEKNLFRAVERYRKISDSKSDLFVSVNYMVADHIVVKLEDGANVEEFKLSLSHLGGYEVRRFLPLSKVYLISFDGKRLENYDQALREFARLQGVKWVEPDFLIQNQI